MPIKITWKPSCHQKIISIDDWPQPVVISSLSHRSFQTTQFRTAPGEQELYGFGNKTIFPPSEHAFTLLPMRGHTLLVTLQEPENPFTKSSKPKSHPLDLYEPLLSCKLFRATLEGPCTVHSERHPACLLSALQEIKCV